MLLGLKQTIPVSVGYMVLSALGFALMAACVKQVSTYGIPVLEIVAVRALISALLSYADIKRKNLSPWGINKPLLFARGLVGAIALFFVYYSVTTLPLAEATLLQYLHPVFTAILALVFLKEAIQRSTLSCITLSMLGLVVMVAPNFTINQSGELAYSWLSIGAAILGALGSAVAYVIVKKLTKTDDSSVIVFYFPFIALPVAIILGGSEFVMPSLPAMGLLLLVGIFTQVGQVGLTKALASADASKATGYAYVQVIFSVLIGWAYFSEVPTLTTLIGGGLIIGGALVNVLWKR
ncbi:EamA family transporter [Saccharobesus litoralis]|uniref:EamA family transporter n=1 Tax=Saccharobesus litoralis TaxID=2172099 RepID=A0A2S0VP79_9ALTE|nr:DMT family transporter [Saccharobesus litoralis]AWB65890.1 EamA family transporter [Saccharobesus litoralis]